mmetsp:Transcript_10148/g.16623  ORF Transcript_10148/g.16623 Transcript_10148/m.16623 type:complete len:99 (+) Transcript_10148:188-484(+)
MRSNGGGSAGPIQLNQVSQEINSEAMRRDTNSVPFSVKETNNAHGSKRTAIWGEKNLCGAKMYDATSSNEASMAIYANTSRDEKTNDKEKVGGETNCR